MKTISSRQNPTIKQLHQLAHSASERRKQQQTVLDGIHLLQGALQHGIALELVCVSEQGLQHPEIQDLIARVEAEYPCLLLTDSVFDYISPTDSPAGVLAVINMPTPTEMSVPTRSCILLESVQDAGNLGTIMRTAVAAGINDLVLSTGCASVWSPRVLRAGMGAHFVMRIQEKSDLSQVIQAYNGQVLATGLELAQSLYDLDLTQPTAWLFGNEGQGLSASLLCLAHQRVIIPMADGIESLNVGAAVAVCLFEQRRQLLHLSA
ncbi:TrmH family RNA methyltransferase [Agitococcus lubricus]|nr:RNA methyltransferase [Agitococcus lubricus]